LDLATGNTLTRRSFEMICLSFSGWADEEEIPEALSKSFPNQQAIIMPNIIGRCRTCRGIFPWIGALLAAGSLGERPRLSGGQKRGMTSGKPHAEHRLSLRQLFTF